jgi:hypothetical protein
MRTTSHKLILTRVEDSAVAFVSEEIHPIPGREGILLFATNCDLTGLGTPSGYQGMISFIGWKTAGVLS